MTASVSEALRAYREGTLAGTLLQALTDAGAQPEMEIREGLHGPSAAIFGGNRTYRYLLTRRFGPGEVMTWVCLNPSTAGAFEDDPVSTRLTKRAAAAGYGALVILNAFALVSTDPAGLYGHADPVGPGNDGCLRAFCEPGSTVVAAWGNHGAFKGRDAAVAAILAASGADLYCLGITGEGRPRHPGRLGYSQRLMPWRPA